MCGKNLVVGDLLVKMFNVTVSIYCNDIYRYIGDCADVPAYMLSWSVRSIVPLNDGLQIWVKS